MSLQTGICPSSLGTDRSLSASRTDAHCAISQDQGKDRAIAELVSTAQPRRHDCSSGSSPPRDAPQRAPRLDHHHRAVPRRTRPAAATPRTYDHRTAADGYAVRQLATTSGGASITCCASTRRRGTTGCDTVACCRASAAYRAAARRGTTRRRDTTGRCDSTTGRHAGARCRTGTRAVAIYGDALSASRHPTPGGRAARHRAIACCLTITCRRAASGRPTPTSCRLIACYRSVNGCGHAARRASASRNRRTTTRRIATHPSARLSSGQAERCGAACRRFDPAQ